MKNLLPDWPLLVAMAIGLLLIISAILSRSPSATPLFPSTNISTSSTEIVAARKNIGESIAAEQASLLTVLGLQMGIVAFAATMVFGKDFKLQSPSELFAILTLLTIILGLVYLHLYKSFLGEYIYAVRLESSLDIGLRSYQQIFQQLAEPEAPWLLRPVISLTNTFYAVSFLPVYVIITASVGFGRKLGIRNSTIWAINILVVAWAVAYLLPVFRLIERVGG
jgi:hypothetical protein